MPLRGTLKTGPRHNFLNLRFYNQFIKDTGSNLTYKQFVDIIDSSCRKMKNKIIDNTEGFKMPEVLGYMATSRYKPKPGTRRVDFGKSQQLGFTVYHTNFHSFGYNARIQWYTYQIAQCRNIEIYKFVPDKEFQALKSNRLIEGKVYNEFRYEHFKLKKIKIRLNRL